jgi:hypothetical protein
VFPDFAKHPHQTALKSFNFPLTPFPHYAYEKMSDHSIPASPRFPAEYRGLARKSCRKNAPNVSKKFDLGPQ